MLASGFVYCSEAKVAHNFFAIFLYIFNRFHSFNRLTIDLSFLLFAFREVWKLKVAQRTYSPSASQCLGRIMCVLEFPLQWELYLQCLAVLLLWINHHSLSNSSSHDYSLTDLHWPVFVIPTCWDTIGRQKTKSLQERYNSSVICWRITQSLRCWLVNLLGAAPSEMDVKQIFSWP